MSLDLAAGLQIAFRPCATPRSVSKPAEAVDLAYHDSVDNQNWFDVIENSLAVRNMYSLPPRLSAVRIMRLEIDEQGPTVLIKVELPAFPDKPPLRWEHRGYNAAVMELRLFGISELKIEGWTTDNVAEISLFRDGDSVRFQALGRGTLISGSGTSADVCRIDGYHSQLGET